jgi:hypothetical protein
VTLMTGVSVSDFYTYGGPTGTASSTQINIALQIAWNQIEGNIGTPLAVSSVTDKHPWPANGMLQLDNSDVTAIVSVKAVHDEGTCNCDTLDVTGCAILWDPVLGVVSVKDCYAVAGCASCSCAGSIAHCGKWVEVVYLAGVGLPLSDSMKLAIVLLAKDILVVITGGQSNQTVFSGVGAITSWHSMDYGENYGSQIAGNAYSAPTAADMIKQLLAPWPRKRLVKIGNPRSARIV